MTSTNNYPGRKHVSNKIALLLFAGLRLARGNNSSCFNDTDAIHSEELRVNDTSIVRTYHLCEETTYKFATFNSTKCYGDNSTGILTDCYDDNGFFPVLVFQPNVHILCGSDGSSSNGCVFQGGTFQLGVQLPSSVPDVVDREDEFIDNVEISGITFREAGGVEGNNVYSGAPANVTLKDCIFTDNNATSCVALYDTDFWDAKNWTGTNSSYLTLDTCKFERNFQQSDFLSIQNITLYTVVQNQGQEMRLIDTTFVDNKLPTDLGDNPLDFANYVEGISALVVSRFGGSLDISGCCFAGNEISLAPVVSFLGDFSKTDNSAVDNTYPLADSIGSFLPQVEGCDGILNVSSLDVETVLAGLDCRTFTEQECRPTESPTSAPSMAPSRSPRPSSSPTTQPSTEPSTEPTKKEPTSAAVVTSHMIRSLMTLPFLCVCLFL